ncbi:MAG: hypothetical protein IID41_10305, partial [Planctomycetes bacterium]|nr:hypothetical protein [Planctomycetota bacterium]
MRRIRETKAEMLQELVELYRRRHHVSSVNLQEVAAWAVNYLGSYAWRAMKDSEDARAWLARHADHTPRTALEKTMREWAEALSELEGDAAVGVVERIAYARHPFRRNPELIEIGRDLGIEREFERWLEDERVSLDARVAMYSQLIQFDPQRYTADGVRELARSIEAERNRKVEAETKTIDGDPRKRWLLHGPGPDAALPPEGFGLLIVFPGGDGSVGFTPFIRDTIAGS